MFIILVHVTFYSCRCMLELKFANYYRAASSPLTGFLCSIVWRTQAFFKHSRTPTVFLIQQSCVMTFGC